MVRKAAQELEVLCLGLIQIYEFLIDATNVLCYSFSTQQAPIPLPVRGFLNGVESAATDHFSAITDGLSVRHQTRRAFH